VQVDLTLTSGCLLRTLLMLVAAWFEWYGLEIHGSGMRLS
jgi:hypothetical protein